MINQEQLIKDITEYAKTITLPTEKATKLFRNSLVDTITNTVSVQEDGKIFVSTGDIPAMWLRDSSFQVLPYLEIAEDVPAVKDLIHGVIKQQLAYIQHDPYSNSFNKTATGAHYNSGDETDIPVSDLVWERKFEIDSLCTPLHLAYRLYEKTGYDAHLNEEFWETVALIVDTFVTEQNHMESPYYFNRPNCVSQDTLSHGGRGAPVGYTGMVWSAFRPSDDACVYGYFVPGNLFIVASLRQLLPIVPDTHVELKERMETLISEIEKGVKEYGTMTVEETGEEIYAYEVDGLGNQLFMDDANVPSLLSLPFLNYCEPSDPLYLTTRKYVLSEYNKYYYSGKYLAGVGSPHTPPEHVWPIAIAMEGLTTNDVEVTKEKMDKIVATDADTLQCHEGVHVDDPSQYTREWFSWSNMTFCQLVFHYFKQSK